VFYPRYVADLISKHVQLARQIWDLGRFRQRLKHDPHARDYMDLALTPVAEDDFDSYEMFSNSESAKSAASKARPLVKIQ
jgi:hypothetical protein